MIFVFDSEEQWAQKMAADRLSDQATSALKVIVEMDKWKSAALKVGEELAHVPVGSQYRSFTPEEWLAWCLDNLK